MEGPRYSVALFVVFMAIFVATAAVTLLGVVGKVPIAEKYLWPLFICLLLQVVGAVVGLFKSAAGLAPLQVALVFDEPSPAAAPTECQYVVRPGDPKRRTYEGMLNVVKHPGALVVTLPRTRPGDSVQLAAEADGAVWQSDAFNPLIYEASLRRRG